MMMRIRSECVIGSADQLGIARRAPVVIVKAIASVHANFTWLVSDGIGPIAKVAPGIRSPAIVNLHVDLGNDGVAEALWISAIKFSPLVWIGALDRQHELVQVEQ